jgi:hypothetical protein
MPNVGVGGLGLTQAATAGMLGHQQGEMQARQLAYQMALRQLMMEKDLSTLNLNRTRARYYGGLEEKGEKTAADLTAAATRYRTKYPEKIGADTPDNEAVRLGQQLDTATLVPGKPKTPATPTASSLNRLKMQRLVGHAGFLLDQGKDPGGEAWTPQTLHDYVKASLNLKDKDEDDLTAAVHQAWRTKKGTGGSFEDFLNNRGLGTPAVPSQQPTPQGGPNSP